MATSRREFVGKLLRAPLVMSSGAKLFDKFVLSGQAALQQRLAADPLRPQYHLLPAKNWMNDPNGPIFWKGQYHMFFQYNPNAAVWGDMHWAHAVSPDMIHWAHLPVALAPTPGWDDADGCFTGSAVDDGGTATILYTGVKTVVPELATLRDGVHNFREVQCLATSDDPQLRSWKKWKTPVIQPPADPLLTGFRDPFLWREKDGWWYLGVASGQRKRGGNVLLYRSKDLRQWEYLHPLASGKWTEKENVNPVDSGEMWECPDFFPLGGKHVLLYSTAGRVAWETGELDRKEMVFHVQHSGVLDHGAYYAQKTQLDAKGNRILWGWIPETRPEVEFSAAGWAGCMALPRTLSLAANDELEMKVAPEAESLRAKELVGVPQAAGEVRIEGVAAEFAWRSSGLPFSLTIADNAGPWWSLRAEAEGSAAKLLINEKTLAIPGGEQMSCRLFLDASVAEFFCNNIHVLTTRIYRQPAGPLRVEPVEAEGKMVKSFQAWQLKGISKDRLTTPAY